MRIVRFVVMFVVLVRIAPTAGETTALRRVVVLSYNIRHGQGMDQKINLERIAAVIRSVSPDAVGVQEVDRKTRRSGGIDQAEELSRLTGLKMVFGRTMDFEGGQYGNMILTRLPIAQSENHPLSYSPGREPRAVLEVKLAATSSSSKPPSGRFSFLATHFDYSQDSTDRLAAVEAIEKLLAAKPDQPVLLAGDLNSTTGSPALKALGRIWRIAGATQRLPTVPVEKPNRQIDFILFHPADRWKVVEVRVLEEAMASDHRPILAVLELAPAPSSPK